MRIINWAQVTVTYGLKMYSHENSLRKSHQNNRATMFNMYFCWKTLGTALYPYYLCWPRNVGNGVYAYYIAGKKRDDKLICSIG